MCVSCSRRLFVGGVVASLLVTPALGAVAPKGLKGCNFSAADSEPPELRPTSGNDDLDRALIIELRNILKVIPNINPGFQYMVDVNPNAFATTETLLPGTSGTVLFGINLINYLLKEPDGGAAVAGMCAHECGHIYQYNNGIQKRLAAVLLTELHADFIAGIYMGKRAGFNADRVKQFSDALHNAGDYAYAEPTYHGTPGQRSAAMEKGYRIAFGNQSFEEMSSIGETYVRNLA